MRRKIRKVDAAKMREFVEEGLAILGGRIEAENRIKDGVLFSVANCDISVLEDVVNQRMGHYAYPWTSWMKSETELEMGFEEYEN